jgi:hypothetical protein
MLVTFSTVKLGSILEGEASTLRIGSKIWLAWPKILLFLLVEGEVWRSVLFELCDGCVPLRHPYMAPQRQTAVLWILGQFVCYRIQNGSLSVRDFVDFVHRVKWKLHRKTARPNIGRYPEVLEWSTATDREGSTASRSVKPDDINHSRYLEYNACLQRLNVITLNPWSITVQTEPWN